MARLLKTPGRQWLLRGGSAKWKRYGEIKGFWISGGAGRGCGGEQVSVHCGAGEHRQHRNWRGMRGGRLMSRGERKKVSSEVCNILLALFSVLLLTILFLSHHLMGSLSE